MGIPGRARVRRGLLSPLYLQLALGLDPLQTGLKMLAVSIAMLAASAAGSRLSTRYSVRLITGAAGLMLSGIACVRRLATIHPDLAGLAFAASMRPSRRPL
jgi:hypothetical protein